MTSTGLSAIALTHPKLNNYGIQRAKPLTFGANSPLRQTHKINKDTFTRINTESAGALEETIKHNGIMAETLSETLASYLKQASRYGKNRFIAKFLDLTKGANSIHYQDTINDGIAAAARHGQQGTLPLLLNVNRIHKSPYIGIMRQLGIRAGAIAAASNGQLETFNYLLERIPEEDVDDRQNTITIATEAAAKHGKLETFNNLVARLPEPQRPFVILRGALVAAANGNLELFNTLLERTPAEHRPEGLLEGAISADRNGHMEAADSLFQAIPEEHIIARATFATRHRDAETLDILLERLSEPNRQNLAYRGAVAFAASGDLETFNSLLERIPDEHRQATILEGAIFATRNGQLAIANHLFTGIPGQAITARAILAAQHGDIRTFDILLARVPRDHRGSFILRGAVAAASVGEMEAFNNLQERLSEQDRQRAIIGGATRAARTNRQDIAEQLLQMPIDDISPAALRTREAILRDSIAGAIRYEYPQVAALLRTYQAQLNP